MTAKQPAHMAHILAHLDATPTGASNAELDRIFADGVGLAMTRLIQRGQAGYTMEPHHGRGRFFHRRYFARKHCPPDATLADLAIARKAVLAAVPKSPDKATVVKPRDKRTPKPEGDAIVPKGVKVTVWQPQPDPRRPATAPDNFFSRGDRVLADTPIQRAYGSRA